MLARLSGLKGMLDAGRREKWEFGTASTLSAWPKFDPRGLGLEVIHPPHLHTLDIPPSYLVGKGENESIHGPRRIANEEGVRNGVDIEE